MERRNTRGLRTMEKLQPIGFVHTPENMQELEDWLGSTKDQLVLTGAYMMYNLLVTHFNKVLEEQDQ
jgi:hypothetical protein